MSTIAPPARVTPAHPRDAAVAFQPPPDPRVHGRRSAGRPPLLAEILQVGQPRPIGRHATGGTR